MEINFAEKRVLIIDDHPGMRSSMRAILSGFGVVLIEMSGTANDGIRRLQAKNFDIIICDYFLGDSSDGQQLLEQLRRNNLISLSTIFIMVTAERLYEKVVSAVELAPDDYLIKPFSGEVLRSRLERIMAKKQAFAAIYHLLEDGKLAEATQLCKELTKYQNKYTIDILRLLAELYVTQGKFDEAQDIYQQVVSLRAVPWARMGLATMFHYKNRHHEAEELLEEVIDEAPEYMAAYDLLSKVCESQEKNERAQQVLERAVAASPLIAHRQKEMGQLAMRNGDMEAAEKAFENVVERGKTSFFRSADDYANLSRVQMERGKTKEALNTLRDVRVSFNGSPEAEFTASVMESLVHKQTGDEAASAKALEAALAIQKTNPIAADENLSLDLAKACFAHGKDDEAKRVIESLVRNNHDSVALIQKAKQIFADAGKGAEGNAIVDGSVKEIIQLNNQGVMKAKEGDLDGSVQLLTEAAEKMPGNLQIILNAAQALLVHIDQRGWNEHYMDSARRYMDTARVKSATHPKLLSINKLAQEVTKKYGVAA
jgi:DNA-binding response OmpR family regulator